MSFWYLASPYSKYSSGNEEAFQEVALQTGLLVQAGVPVFSPIAHTHPIALYAGMDPLDHTIWLPCDRPMMDAAGGIIVCMMDGWRESYGVAHEIEVFRAAGKPVVFMQPGTIPPLPVLQPAF